MSSKPVYIVSAKRSAVAKAFRGSFAHKRPDDLCADVIKAILKENPNLDPTRIDDVYVGCAMPEAEQGMNIARFALLLAGLPESVSGVTINRFCSSGVQTIAMAADRVAAGHADCILAGGAESMSMIPMMGHKVVGSRTVMDHHPEFYLSMGLTAENVAQDFGVSREDQDQFAYESHVKAMQAIEAGHFKEEIIPISCESRRATEGGKVEIKSFICDQDEGPRKDTSVESLLKLKSAFKTKGSVTAGNSSQMSDGAAMCFVVSEAFVKEFNLTPEARFCAFEVAGVPPRVMGIGPIEAIPKALKRAGLTLKDINRIELNEAFASQALAVMRRLDLDPKIVNPSGGAIALGHPLGATGAKLAATLLRGLKREKGRYGLVSMCIGTGMGACGVFENLK
jgi:acetyl-CoA acyltransferase